MARKILYKGLGKDNKKIWRTGYYWKTNDTTYCFKEDYDANPNNTHHYILFDRMTDWGLPNKKYQAEIDVDTLCEYTGRQDKNGTMIWENDIVKCIDKEENRKFMGTVAFDNCSFYISNSFSSNYRWLDYEIEVIGNIFDNPELLEE